MKHDLDACRNLERRLLRLYARCTHHDLRPLVRDSQMRWPATSRRRGCKTKQSLGISDDEALPVLPDHIGTQDVLQLLVDALSRASQQLRQFSLLEMDVEAHLAAVCAIRAMLVHQLGQMSHEPRPDRRGAEVFDQREQLPRLHRLQIQDRFVESRMLGQDALELCAWHLHDRGSGFPVGIGVAAATLFSGQGDLTEPMTGRDVPERDVSARIELLRQADSAGSTCKP